MDFLQLFTSISKTVIVVNLGEEKPVRPVVFTLGLAVKQDSSHWDAETQSLHIQHYCFYARVWQGQ